MFKQSQNEVQAAIHDIDTWDQGVASTLRDESVLSRQVQCHVWSQVVTSLELSG